MGATVKRSLRQRLERSGKRGRAGVDVGAALWETRRRGRSPRAALTPRGSFLSRRTTESTTAVPALAEGEQVRLGALHAVMTHTGLVREANEDNYVAIPERGVYVVADGMGGHVAGQVASEICVQSVEAYFDGRRGERLVDETQATGLSGEALELAESLLLANRRIFETATRQRELAGMGTTAVGIRLIGNRIAVAHAGDSRCYLLRGDDMAQVTVDHSLSNFLLALGRDIEARYAEQTMSNVIMRALGLEADVAIDTKEFLVQPGDRLLLCSDGLSDLVTVDQMTAQIVGSTIEDAVQALVGAALDEGGRDNITALVVEIVGVAPALPASSFSETLEIPASSVIGDAGDDAAPEERVDLATTLDPLADSDAIGR